MRARSPALFRARRRDVTASAAGGRAGKAKERFDVRSGPHGREAIPREAGRPAQGGEAGAAGGRDGGARGAGGRGGRGPADRDAHGGRRKGRGRGRFPRQAPQAVALPHPGRGLGSHSRPPAALHRAEDHGDRGRLHTKVGEDNGAQERARVFPQRPRLAGAAPRDQGVRRRAGHSRPHPRPAGGHSRAPRPRRGDGPGLHHLCGGGRRSEVPEEGGRSHVRARPAREAARRGVGSTRVDANRSAARPIAAAAGLTMQFIDEAEILVKAGDGGPGAVAFRREKFAPRGGPSGGDGGNGGDIVLQTDERLTTLLDFRFKREYRARNGEPGRGRDQNGHAAAELLLKIPPGTVVKDAGTGEVLADLRENERRWVMAKGGRGGLGNMNFATSTLQAPRFAQPGTEGEEKRIKLELRLLADVGLVGFPNAGKSTLVSRLSRARPKIADYPFTTLEPHLGVVQYRDARSFVLSDLPGLIEGAHRGAGLGHRFLKHMARCRTIIHLIDASQDRDLVADFDAINRELEIFDPALGRKAQVVAANKIDVPEGRERAEELRKKLKKRKIDVHLVSGATGEGLPELLDATVRALDAAPMPSPLERDVHPLEHQPETEPKNE